ncbi:hypothetical protein JKP88DRAFT_241139 [Tribonema minus]|uniref:Uncharacterized protein n=1 Tax=Tribonema minus TaxID=303371 RepID=A0A836CII8_9STRA|nr:hypothetical protein JKP88DRAFT_241139 [Tribonema minus]
MHASRLSLGQQVVERMLGTSLLVVVHGVHDCWMCWCHQHSRGRSRVSTAERNKQFLKDMTVTDQLHIDESDSSRSRVDKWVSTRSRPIDSRTNRENICFKCARASNVMYDWARHDLLQQAAAAGPGRHSLPMARPVVMAMFRNTQRRWLRAAVGSTAFCIIDTDGKHEVLAKVMALAARRYGAAAAAGVVIADIDEAAAPDAVLPDNTHVIHANIFALFKTFSQEMKAMPTQQAFELATDLCIIGRNRIQGRVIEVIDPLWPRSGPGTPRDSCDGTGWAS